VACETLVTTGQVVLAGEVKSKAYLDVQQIAREVIERIGYTKSEYMFEAHSCGVLSAIHEQSPDINQGVERKKPEEQGAGDQGMMFGYACRDTDNYMPLPLEISHMLLRELAVIRREKNSKMPYLRPDAKSQVTIEYNDDGTPKRIDAIVVSTQHDDFDKEAKMLAKIKKDVIDILIPRVKKQLPKRVQALFGKDIAYHINPTGKFVIGGPHGDTGLTGRKIIVDTYGGKGAHGGGAFSGKDPSKVDRSAAYAARHVAKHLVAAGVCDEVLVQVAYAIGVAKPVGFYVNTYGTSKVKMTDGQIAKTISGLKEFDMRPTSSSSASPCAPRSTARPQLRPHGPREQGGDQDLQQRRPKSHGQGEALPLGGTQCLGRGEEGFQALIGHFPGMCHKSPVDRHLRLFNRGLSVRYDPLHLQPISEERPCTPSSISPASSSK
jgi:S-adenosylmethionine synthetase